LRQLFEPPQSTLSSQAVRPPEQAAPVVDLPLVALVVDPPLVALVPPMPPTAPPRVPPVGSPEVAPAVEPVEPAPLPPESPVLDVPRLPEPESPEPAVSPDFPLHAVTKSAAETKLKNRLFMAATSFPNLWSPQYLTMPRREATAEVIGERSAVRLVCRCSSAIPRGDGRSPT